MNLAILKGNLTRDPEIRYTKADKAVCSFSIGMNETWIDKASGEKKQKACFVNISVWGNQAKSCETYLLKGSPVLITGKLVQDTWEDADGNKKSMLKVTATYVEFLHKAPPKDNSADYTNPEIDTEEMEPAKGEEFETPVDENEVPF